MKSIEDSKNRRTAHEKRELMAYSFVFSKELEKSFLINLLKKYSIGINRAFQ